MTDVPAATNSPEPEKHGRIHTLVEKAVEKTAEKTAVTSPPGKTNWRDRVLAFTYSFAVAVFGLMLHIWSVLVQVLDSVADQILPYLQSVPQKDKPLWVALITFVAMGLIILNKRRISNPNYLPPQAAPSLVPPQPAATTPPAADVPPQGQPLPPGTPVDTSQSAF